MKITVNQVKELRNSVFIRTNDQDGFVVLTNPMGDTFDDLMSAINFVRETMQGTPVELSMFDQAMLDNGEWDNF